MSLGSIFNHQGAIDAEYVAAHEADIQALPDGPAREAFFALLKADTENKDGQDHFVAARKAVNEKSAAYDKALAENEKLNPPQNQAQLVAEVVAAHRGVKIAPKGEAAIAAAKKIVDRLTKELARADEKSKAQIEAKLDQAKVALALAEKPAKAKEALHHAVTALALARDTLIKANADARKLQQDYGKAVLNWLAVNPDKKSDLQVRREAADASNQRIAAQIKAKPPTGRKVWPIEQVLQNAGRARKEARQPRTYFGPR
jgi:hypothetical protein